MLVIGLILSYNTNAQTISLKNAVDSSLKNNLLLKEQNLKIQYQKSLIGTAYDIPKTALSLEYGQTNSNYLDNRLSITQSISFPTVYAHQKHLQTMHIEQENLTLDLSKKQLTKKVSELFFNLVFLYQKQKLLQKMDSLIIKTIQNAQLRYVKGDANILEKIIIETQQKQIQWQLKEIQTEIQNTQKEFQYWLNTKQTYIPDTTVFMHSTMVLDTSMLNNHAQMRILAHAARTAQIKINVEKHKFLPDIYFGFFSQTLQGIGSDNVFYPPNRRFTSFQIGIGIPLFYTYQKANLTAAKLSYRITQQQYNIGIKLFQTQYQIAYNNYQLALQKVRFLETEVLPQSKIMIEQANQQLALGAIHYSEWANYIQNAIQMQINYIENLKNLNLSLIELEYYQTK